MPLAFLALAAASNATDAVIASRRRLAGVPLYYVSDQCAGSGSRQAAGVGTCMVEPDEYSVDPNVRPAGHGVQSWQVAVRCCWNENNGNLRCDSEYDGTTDCYGYGKTWEQAEEICANDGRRLCTIAELRSSNTNGGCCGSGCQYDNYFVWTSEQCDTYYYPPSPPPSPPPAPPPHPPVCSYRIPDKDNTEEVCEADERITTEEACRTFDLYLRNGGGKDALGLVGSMYSFLVTTGTNAVPGCNIYYSASMTRVYFRLTGLDSPPALGTGAGGGWHAACGSCYPPSPPPSPPPLPPPSPPPAPLAEA